MFGRYLVRVSMMSLVVLACELAQAATTHGTVEAVSVEEKTVTIKLNGKKEESKEFTLGPNVVILVDGKKATLDDISDGQTAIVTANSSNVAAKIVLKSPKTPVVKKPSRPPAGDSEAVTGTGGSWPQYRGPNRDNISLETDLLDAWPDSGPKLIWEQKNLGEGFSSVSISEGKLFTMGNQGSNEMLLAMDVSSGKPLWATKTGGNAYRNGMGNGPRGTPTVDNDRVYALGANGDLICAGVDNGEIVWHKNILQEYGGENIQWGISESVLIDGNKVICCPGGRQATIVALDKLTGRGLWRSSIQGAPKASYASPILVEYGGERMIVNYVHTAVVAVRAKSGDVLWGYPTSANPTANCSTPLYEDGMVFTASGYGTGCAMFKLGPNGKATGGYSNKEMKNHHGGMVVLDGHVYGFDEQILRCLDLKTGDSVWQDRSVGKGSLTCADGHLYLRSEKGEVALCKATPNGYEESGRFDPANRSDKPAWAHPVVCGGRLYLRDMDTLTVYDLKK
ncbi:MAG: PQQ-like beta-propeller repeat protein [Planctomycetes bacterium]|nr:PQQ-like beta-propeller repeat protein [Planctomycetota bacterium]